MSTNTLIGILVAIVVVAAGAWYFMSGTGTGTLAPQEDATESGSESSSGATGSGNTASGGTAPVGRGSGTFADLIGRTGNYKCTFDSRVENSQTSGTIYVGGGKMRGDFTSIAEGVRVESHMARQGGYIYTWTNLSNNGFKLREQASAAAPSGSSASQGVDASMTVTYDCSPWIVDARLLEIPSNISFMTAPGQ